ncbi:MAG: SRPBCC domain-containing protein [Myxococcales bacterium FL481]|nr:MAG: SRPBCC domain-containing protein [Myxococcales bacterium FL481]
MTDPPLVVERMYEAGCAELFDAWTDPALIQQWFFVDPTWHAEVSADVRPGGSYTLSMITTDGERHTMTGRYLELERPRRVVFTWNSHVTQDTKVTVEIEPVGSKTRVRLIHEGISDPAARPPHERGWTGCLANLDAWLVAAASP